MNKKHQTEDKLMAVYYKAVDFFEENKKHLYIALSIVVLVVAGFILLSNKRKADNEKAAVELSKIKDIYASGNYLQAINGDSLGVSKGLLNLVNEYGSTETGESAKILLANCYFNLREFDNAEKYYKDYSGSNLLLKVTSDAGIASVYEAKNNYEAAAKEFEKAASIDKTNPFIDQYLYYAAKNYYRANNLSESKKILDKLKNDFPKSKYVTEAEKFKVSLN
ncbi:MAG TPA: tetratricopeptide repeat protein [Ignavibacteria bacterium]|nr:tetratricopeptide repeat protein [Ignavibacteria bacterium]